VQQVYTGPKNRLVADFEVTTKAVNIQTHARNFIAQTNGLLSLSFISYFKKVNFFLYALITVCINLSNAFALFVR
jgi:hypothetical protein